MADYQSKLPVLDGADGATGSAAPSSVLQVGGSDGTNLRTLSVDTTGKLNINNISGTVTLPTGAATSANQTNASQKTQIVDGSGNVITSYNSQLSTDDIINASISSGSITVSTTAVAARVGASNLTNRKMLMISPINGVVYIGASSSVTTATGIPIFPNNIISFSFSSGVTPFLIAASSITVNVFEGA